MPSYITYSSKNEKDKILGRFKTTYFDKSGVKYNDKLTHDLNEKQKKGKIYGLALLRVLAERDDFSFDLYRRSDSDPESISRLPCLIIYPNNQPNSRVLVDLGNISNTNVYRYYHEGTQNRFLEVLSASTEVLASPCHRYMRGNVTVPPMESFQLAERTSTVSIQAIHTESPTETTAQARMQLFAQVKNKAVSIEDTYYRNGNLRMDTYCDSQPASFYPIAPSAPQVRGTHEDLPYTAAQQSITSSPVKNETTPLISNKDDNSKRDYADSDKNKLILNRLATSFRHRYNSGNRHDFQKLQAFENLSKQQVITMNAIEKISETNTSRHTSGIMSCMSVFFKATKTTSIKELEVEKENYATLTIA